MRAGAEASPRGERLIGKAPHGRWRTLTFIAALRIDRIEAPCVFDGPINGESFLAYVEQVLVPTLRSGDVVVIDNLGSHKGKAVVRAISRRRRQGSCSCRPTRPRLGFGGLQL
jgi:putative transposase